MPKMPNTLALKDPRSISGPPAVIALLVEWHQALKTAYEKTYTDIHHKELIYFDVNQTKWRMGPYPPRTPTYPDGDFSAAPSDWNMELQYFTGTDYANQWRNNGYWKRMTRSYAGTD